MKYDTRHLRNERYCVGIIRNTLTSDAPSERDEDYLAVVARKARITPGSAHYFPQLARFPGDPEAFVSSRDEIKRVLEKRGWSASGLVDYEPRSRDTEREYKPADDLVNRYVEEHISANPSDAKYIDDLKHEYANKLAGNRD